MLTPHFVNLIEVLHVADIDIYATDVVHGTARVFDCGLDIFAQLSRLGLDIADAGNGTIYPTRSHSGDKSKTPARFDHGLLPRFFQLIGVTAEYGSD